MREKGASEMVLTVTGAPTALLIRGSSWLFRNHSRVSSR